MNLNLNPFEDILDPFGIIDFGKDQYNANRDYGHTREIFDDSNRFAEYMSNSAYQRATADMKAAGLNPMLAYQQGGASSPHAAAAPPFSRANSSAGSLHSAAQVQNIRQQTELLKAQTTNEVARGPGVKAESSRLAYELENLVPSRMQSATFEMEIKAAEAMVAMAKQDFLSGIEGGKSSPARIDAVARLLKNHFESEFKELPSDVRLKMLEAALRELDLEWYLPKLVGKAAMGVMQGIGIGSAIGRFGKFGGYQRRGRGGSYAR